MKIQTARMLACLTVLATLLTSVGCAAFRPIPGVPARYLAPELRAISRNNEATIDLSMLTQVPPRQHLVDGGDVLGIYIEGVLGRPGEAPPITVPTTPDLPPAIGYPITVRDDGTLSLPMVGSINVRGMTIRQVEERLRHLYTVERDILKIGQDRIIVSLQRPRQIRVLVLRQETGGSGGTEFAQGLSINLGQTKRGNGQAIDLPIYKNDVLHALARTGGLPGLDAENTIYIIRRQHQPVASAPVSPGYAPAVPQQLQNTFVPQQTSARSFNETSVIQQVSHENQTWQPLNSEAYPHQPAYAANPPGTAWQQPAQQPTQFSIQPVQARNFGSGNSLEQLRSGMQTDESSLYESTQYESTQVDSYGMSQQEMSQYNTLPVYSASQPTHSQTTQSDAAYQGDSANRGLPASQALHSAPVQSGYPGMTEVSYPGYSQTYVAPEPYFAPTQTYQTPDQSQPAPLVNQYGSYDAAHHYPSVQPGFDDSQNSAHDAYGTYNSGVHSPTPYDPIFNWADSTPTMNNSHVIKIPVRLKPGEQPQIRPDDIVLHEGDILFIETRETEIYYTGGLLGGGQYTLPRDYDLDVLGAVSIAQAASPQQVGRQLGGASAINGDVTISASDVIILRQLPNGSQVSIKVDLYRAIKDPSERVIIQPGDIVMLRYKPLEAVGAFIERNLLESALFGLAASQMPSSR